MCCSYGKLDHPAKHIHVLTMSKYSYSELFVFVSVSEVSTIVLVEYIADV